MTTPLLSPLDTFKKALNPIVSNIHILSPNVRSAIGGLNSTYVRIGSLGSFKKIGIHVYTAIYTTIKNCIQILIKQRSLKETQTGLLFPNRGCSGRDLNPGSSP